MPKKGFTLMEALVAIALVAIVSAVGFVLSTRFVVRQSLAASAEDVSTVLRRAHVFDREAKDDKAWGVVISSTNTYRLVSGTPAEPVTEASFDLKSPIEFEPAGGAFWFGQGTGYTANNEIKLVSPGGESVTLRVSDFGVVEAL